MESNEDREAVSQTVDDSDDDLEQVAALQQSLHVPVITSVKQAKTWTAKPAAEKTGRIEVSMTLFTKRKFARGWYLNLIDAKRAATFPTSKAALESLAFTVRKNYLVSITLYLVPFGLKEPTQVPDVIFKEGSILHFAHVTGFKIDQKSGIPRGNASGLDQVTEQALTQDTQPQAVVTHSLAPPQHETLEAATQPLPSNSLSQPQLDANASPPTSTDGIVKPATETSPVNTPLAPLPIQVAALQPAGASTPKRADETVESTPKPSLKRATTDDATTQAPPQKKTQPKSQAK